MVKKVVFLDSGLGGLSVLRSTIELRDDLHYHYFFDHKNLPYGDKKSDWLVDRAKAVVGRLIQDLDPDLFVIACNTLSVCALASLRSSFDIPFVGVVPAVKPAAAKPGVDKVAILSTSATGNSEYLRGLVGDFAANKKVKSFASEDLVLLAETIFLGKTIKNLAYDKRSSVESLLQQVKLFQPQAVVLGCTHFFFIKDVLLDYLGSDVALFDSSDAVARQIDRILPKKGRPKGKAVIQVLSSQMMSAQLKRSISSVNLGWEWVFSGCNV